MELGYSVLLALNQSRFGAQKASDIVQPSAIDLNQVAARLDEISDKKDSLIPTASQPVRYERSPTRSCSPPPLEDVEGEYYDELVKTGGRPSYPKDVMYQVSSNPEKYREVLRPWQIWQNARNLDWLVVRIQYEKWQDFRQWQQENRGIRNDDAGFLAYAETRNRVAARRGRFWPGTTELDKDLLRRGWYDKQYERRRDFHWLREGKTYSCFSEYVEDVKRRLERHGFTRAFELDEDLNQQDKLATWIEYLHYEYAWYDRHTRMFEHLRPKHEEAWQMLVGSKVLRPHETEEYLRSDASGFKSQREEDAAARDVKTAESAARSVLAWAKKTINDSRSSITPKERVRKTEAAAKRLTAAKTSLKNLKRRGDLITRFIRGSWDYDTERENKERQNILLQWILDQFPLIKAKKGSDTAGNSDTGAGSERKAKRNREEAYTDERDSKRRKSEFALPSTRSNPAAGRRKGDVHAPAPIIFSRNRRLHSEEIPQLATWPHLRKENGSWKSQSGGGKMAEREDSNSTRGSQSQLTPTFLSPSTHVLAKNRTSRHDECRKTRHGRITKDTKPQKCLRSAHQRPSSALASAPSASESGMTGGPRRSARLAKLGRDKPQAS